LVFIQTTHIAQKSPKALLHSVALGYALFDRQIATNDEFQAWRHGPVSTVLYSKYRGNPPWVELKPDPDWNVGFDCVTEEHLESVWLTYGELSGYSLEALTHPEFPWQNARAGILPKENSNVKIRVTDMKDYYRSQYIGGEE
jgi:uncharacterized phage-associated protein